MVVVVVVGGRGRGRGGCIGGGQNGTLHSPVTSVAGAAGGGGHRQIFRDAGRQAARKAGVAGGYQRRGRGRRRRWVQRSSVGVRPGRG